MKTMILMITVFASSAFATEDFTLDSIEAYNLQARQDIEVKEEPVLAPVPKKKATVSIQKKEKKPKNKAETIKPIEVEKPENQAQHQWSLGYETLDFKNNGVKDKISAPVVGVNLKGMAVGVSDMDFGLRADLMYGTDGSKSVTVLNIQGEAGYRVYLGKRFSVAPHVVIGGAYIDYKNSSLTTFNQFNEVNGFVFSYGGNIDASFQVKKGFNIGLKYDYTIHKINFMSETESKQVGPSAFVQFSF